MPLTILQISSIINVRVGYKYAFGIAKLYIFLIYTHFIFIDYQSEKLYFETWNNINLSQFIYSPKDVLLNFSDLKLPLFTLLLIFLLIPLVGLYFVLLIDNQFTTLTTLIFFF